MDKNQISEKRRAIYSLGLILSILGPVTCFCSLAYAFLSIGTAHSSFNSGPNLSIGTAHSSFNSGPNPIYVFVPFLFGTAMFAIGKILMRLGARGLAGSGLKLDPDEARKDLKPWSKMAGGMLHDAGISPDFGQRSQSHVPMPDFDERLRKLHRLHRDGILNDQEYADQKAAVLQAMKK